jgi:hypothetical protein
MRWIFSVTLTRKRLLKHVHPWVSSHQLNLFNVEGVVLGACITLQQVTSHWSSDLYQVTPDQAENLFGT